MIGGQSDSVGTDARVSEPMAGDEFEGPMTQISLEAKSVFGSNAAEYAASVAGSIHLSLDDAICPGFRSRAAAGAISQILSDSIFKSCSS